MVNEYRKSFPDNTYGLDMNREEWMAAETIIHAMKVLNSLHCQKDNESQSPDLDTMAKHIQLNTSRFMTEDLSLMMDKLKNLDEELHNAYLREQGILNDEPEIKEKK